MTDNLPAITSDFRRLRDAERPLVLATIVETQGSTYQKAGARMLIDDNGQFYGLLGGGCFEPDLVENARSVFETGLPRLITYDMRADDDALWGLGLGCAGAVTIFLQRLSRDAGYEPLNSAAGCIAANQKSMLITVIESENSGITPGISLVQGKSGHADIPAEFFEEVDATATALDGPGECRIVEHLVDGNIVRVFYSPVRPPSRLLLVGGGPDAVPIIAIAKTLGWHVTVLDHREQFARADRFPGADAVRLCPPESLAGETDLDGLDAAVLMTHRIEYDERYLRTLAAAAIPYIGLLGPVARREKLLEGLDPESARTIAGHAFGPVGLDIGGRRPEEIALSLVAQIQAVLNERPGGHLADPSLAAKAAAEKLSRLYVIVLAAGGSTRFGALKQLLEFKGESLLRRAVRVANALADDRVIVVHGPKPTKCQREIASLPAEGVVNEEWQSGMASSLRRGIRALPADCPGALIMLCDQPFIDEPQLRRLAEAWAGDPERIAACAYSETIGAPAIFPATLFPGLQRLSGDSGARSLIEKHADDILRVSMPEAEIDIDTQEDFASALMNA